jgi:hypothetical protein
MDLKNRRSDQNAWSSYVYDQWLPQQLGSLGGGGGYDVGSDLGGFRGMMNSPRPGEEGAARNLFNSIISGARGPTPSFDAGGLSDLAQAEYTSGMNQQFQDQLFGLRQERAEARQSTLQELMQQAIQLASSGWTPEQVQAFVQSGAQTSGFNYGPKAMGFLDTMGPIYGVDEAAAQRDAQAQQEAAWQRYREMVAAGEITPEQGAALSQPTSAGAYDTDPLGAFRQLAPPAPTFGDPSDVAAIQGAIEPLRAQLGQGEGMPAVREILRAQFPASYQADPGRFDQIVNAIMESIIPGVQFRQFGPSAAVPGGGLPQAAPDSSPVPSWMRWGILGQANERPWPEILRR